MDTRLTREEEIQLQDKLIEWVLYLRSEVLSERKVNVLEHWNQIQNAMFRSSKTNASISEWITSTRKRFRLEAASLDSSRCSHELSVIAEDARESALEYVERNIALIIARARLLADEQSAAKKEKRK